METEESGMKLWEVIKALTEDPTKKFEISNEGSGIATSYVERIGSDGKYLWYSKNDNGISSSGAILEDNVDLNNNNWQLVRQPVTWQEAIQAWAAGEIVSVKVGGRKYLFADKELAGRIVSVKVDGRKYLFADKELADLTKRMINLGTWYVED